MNPNQTQILYMQWFREEMCWLTCCPNTTVVSAEIPVGMKTLGSMIALSNNHLENSGRVYDPRVSDPEANGVCTETKPIGVAWFGAFSWIVKDWERFFKPTYASGNSRKVACLPAFLLSAMAAMAPSTVLAYSLNSGVQKIQTSMLFGVNNYFRLKIKPSNGCQANLDEFDNFQNLLRSFIRYQIYTKIQRNMWN